MRLRWTPAAADDLESIGDDLALHLSSFAQSTILEIYQTILTLAAFHALSRTPWTGRRNPRTGPAAPALYRGLPREGERC